MKYAALIILVLVNFIHSQNPGARVVFSSVGINNAIQKYTPDFEHVILTTPIPDFHVTEHVSLVGNVDVSITNIKVVSVDLGKLGVTMKSPNLLAIRTDAAEIGLSVSWAYKQQDWPHLSSSGTADAYASNTTIYAQLAFTAIDGKFKVKTQNVTIQIRDSKVNIHGGVVAWFLGLLESLFRSTLRTSVQKSIVSAVTEAVDTDLNAVINKTSFTPEIKIPKEGPKLDWILDLSLPADGLVVTESYFSVSSAVTSYPVTSKDPLPFKPVSLPTSPISAQDDANIFLTDYIANSLTYVLHNTRQLQYIVLPEDVPPDSPIKLNTTAFKLWLPDLYNKFPDKSIRIDVATEAYPQVSFTPASINAIVNTSLLFSVYNADQTLTKAFSVSFNVLSRFTNASVSSSQAGTVINVFGKLDVQSDMKLLESYIGNVNVTTFGKVMQLIVIGGQVNALNKKLAAGIPIDLHQAIPGLIIDNSKLSVNTGYLAITAHVAYIPPTSTTDNVSAVMELLGNMIQQITILQDRVSALERKLAKCSKIDIPVQ